MSQTMIIGPAFSGTQGHHDELEQRAAGEKR
jgi:hypothetical protein